MMGLPGIAPQWWLVLAGWSALVVLWHTTAIALLFGIWRLWRRDSPSSSQYAAAIVALGTVVVLTAATPMILMSGPSASTTAPVVPGTRAPSGLPRAALSSVVSRDLPASLARSAPLDDIVPWLGAAWFAGFVVGILRLAGGWTVTRWIRQRATPVTAERILENAVQASDTCRLPPATLLTSEHVEAPVVVGHFSPAIILPRDAEQRLPAAAMPPLIAHELAHIARRDYLANFVQSVADAALFFSPGARWISRCIRDAREFCCDDLVAARCGHAPYVNALTTLASLGALSRRGPAVGAVGPRLIVRIRRLLKEDAMTSFVAYRLTALTAVLALVALAGSGVVRLSAGGVASAVAPARRPIDDSQASSVPGGYMTRQPGSAVVVRSIAASADGICGTAVVYNGADVAVTGLRFVAVVSAPGSGLPVSLGVAEWRAVDVPSLTEATVDIGLMPAAEARTRMNGARSQVMCALQEIRFANDATWQTTQNPSAITAEKALGLPPPEIARILIGSSMTSSETHVCFDADGGGYSEGALVGVALEPGRFARCAGGRWTDYVATPVPAKPFVQLELQWTDGPGPLLKVEPGQMAAVRLGSANYGLLPTVDGVNPARIHVVVYDLESQPRQQVADLFATVGGAAVSSATNPRFSIRVISSPTK